MDESVCADEDLSETDPRHLWEHCAKTEREALLNHRRTNVACRSSLPLPFLYPAWLEEVARGCVNSSDVSGRDSSDSPAHQYFDYTSIHDYCTQRHFAVAVRLELDSVR